MNLTQLKSLFLSIILFTTLILLNLTLFDIPNSQIKSYEPPPTYLNVTNLKFLRNNPNLCSANRNNSSSNENILLILVHSARSNFLKRSLIRRTFGSITQFQNWDIKLVFNLGAKSPKTSESKEIESNEDIIIGDFIDTYKNLSIKHIMGYKWVLENCPQAQYILKIDDDVGLDIPLIFSLITQLNSYNFQGRKYHIACYIHYGISTIVLRSRSSKNSASFEEYPGFYYPEFCGGLGYLIDRKLVQQIYEIHSKIRFLRLDDVWVTGVLRSSLPRNDFEMLQIHLQMHYPATELGNLTKWYKNFTNLSVEGQNYIYLFPQVNEIRMITLWFKTIAVYLHNNDYHFNIKID